MGATLTPSWLPTAIFVPLVGFGLYRRFKRSFGRQPLRPAAMVARMVLLSTICILFVTLLPTSMTGALAAAGGAAAGIGLAYVGLAHTTYEASAEGRFYTPNRWIGLVVTTLFIGRLAARMITIYTAAEEASWITRHALPKVAQASTEAPTLATMQRSPLTLGLLFVMAGYYVAYYAGVLRKGRTLEQVAPPPAT